tara:strand:+ start:165 stop:512 length:348 start_codon:yes stop_codon:yes gene_type:complete
MVMSKKLLWLDDIRNPLLDNWLSEYAPEFCDKKGGVIWVKNSEEFLNWINSNGLPYMICFDNDLGEKTEGYDLAKWLVEYCLDNDLELPNYGVQSANTVASIKIKNLFNNFNNRL